MKGIFLKEFYQFKANILNFIIISIFFIIISSYFNVIFAELIILVTIFIIMSTTLLTQEMLNNKNDFNMYLKILLINANKIIVVKYLFMLCIIVLFLFISFIYSFFINENEALS